VPRGDYEPSGTSDRSAMTPYRSRVILPIWGSSFYTPFLSPSSTQV
jgi:hypothetical protein